MIELIQLPKFNDDEYVELTRMLLARKLMPEDTIGILSPMVNAPLSQCCFLIPSTPVALASWLPRLKKQFINEMSDKDIDPALSSFLRDLTDDAARRNIISQYFLPFWADPEFALASVDTMADAFAVQATLTPPILDLGPLFPAVPQEGRLVLPKPFANSIYDQLLIGRHSHIHLEALRRGDTNKAASDKVIHVFMDALSSLNDGTTPIQPFHARQLRQSDLAQSFAYTQMMELGLSREEMIGALSPWTLVNG